uniref:hypothetical protein n=1 Tax=Arsenophonus apicola TaxID=2879119 RepID=UPI0028731380|nr:hypothetical protein [Arsenophonus apicola]
MLLADIPYPSKSHEMSGLAAGTDFYFRARLVDKSGNQSPWTEFVRGEAEFDASSIIDEIDKKINDTEAIKQLKKGIDSSTEAILENAKGLNGNTQYFMRQNGKMKAEIVRVDNYVVTETKALAESIHQVRATADKSWAAAQNSLQAKYDMKRVRLLQLGHR